MNFKKILALVLVVVMTAAITFGATLAFLTDETEIKHNVFTAGNVKVSLTEKVSATSNGKATETTDGAVYTLVAPGDKLEKEVTVTNDGTLDAYVAVTVKLNNADKINAAIDDIYEKAPYNYDASKIQAIYDEVFEGWGINYNPRPGAAGVNDARGVIDGAGSVWKLPEEVLHVDFAKTITGSTVIGATNWFIAGKEKAGQYWVDGPAGYDGFYTTNMSDYEICYTYYIALPAGESVTLFEGLNVPEYFVNEQMAMFDGLEIDISGAAIQADNFGKFADEEAAKAAFEALYGLTEPMIPDTVTDDPAVLGEALSNGKNVLMIDDIKIEAKTTAPYGNKYGFAQNGGVLDGNGNELEVEVYGDDYGIMTSGGTIKNLTMDSGCRAIMIMYPQEDVIVDNVNIGGADVLYPINTGEAGADGVDLIVTNSILSGWTSYGNIESASFTNCTFGQGTYYGPTSIYGRVLKPYVNTTLTDCKFVEHMNLDLSSLIVGHKVIFENCTVNGVPVDLNVFTIPTSDAEYDTELFTIDLPSWANSISDCVIVK